MEQHYFPEARIITQHWPKPIPQRGFDWSATYTNYDGDGTIGYGRTEAEAVLDLIEMHPRGEQCICGGVLADSFGKA